MPLKLLVSALLLFVIACGGSDPEPRTPVARQADELQQQLSPTEARPEPTSTPKPASNPWSEPPVLEQDPAALAEQIATAERAVRDAAVEGAELAWMGHLQQMAYRRLVENPEQREAVLAALSEEVRDVARRNLEAGIELRGIINPGTELPSWRIVEPAPADELLGHYSVAEEEFGVPWSYLAAIHLVETFMGRIRGTSNAGAQGPMQFIPSTWEAYGEGDINDHRDAIRAAARYLQANGAPGDMASALFAYNRSQRYVRAVTTYAEMMRAEPEAFRGYYHWQVYYLTTEGDAHLPVGYGPD